MMTRQPSLFISHGAPTLVIDPSPARDFLAGLGPQLERPRAILVISAHYNADRPTLTASAALETIHDFRGFGPDMNAMQYPAPGDPLLAGQARALLRAAGFDAVSDAERGLDHGAWVPLKLLYPQADVPVVQLSISMNRSPEWHYRLGQALAPLREEGVLVLGSGGTTHNLRAFFTGGYGLDAASPDWVDGFADELGDILLADDPDEAVRAISTLPAMRLNHPTPDHILPLFVALGAGAGEAVRRLHRSATYGVLRMDAFGFGCETLAA
ncbi:DODA-type extradiol aromatic ring-opening family dioxygenase [Henriciella aquimarina]|uniref:DODA-type extradiol aromatic ring-opening family dioxygenase n=1 Tax=Henriciella aquimarina TaxID=545261 RepID=UPI001F1A2B56|nr:class III extradiol ring-cleavage dioxygenase [Henriciella aquimarina]